MDEQELLRRLREAFKMESAERLASLSTRLMELEKTDNAQQCQEILEVVYREAHSLKGAARAVNLTEIEAISQTMEGVFGGFLPWCARQAREVGAFGAAVGSTGLTILRVGRAMGERRRGCGDNLAS